MHICWSPVDVVSAIAQMPSRSPLPLRTVLVPNAYIGRDIRRMLLTSGHEQLLAGTRMIAASVLADAVLRRAGIPAELGEDDVREHRIAVLIADGIDPPGFGRELLRETVGWAAAFAATIGDLERADLRPSDLVSPDPIIAGARAVWEATDAAAGSSWTYAKALSEAGRRLELNPDLHRADDAVLAITLPDVDAASARFIRAIPNANVALLNARPLRARGIERLTAMLGERERAAALHVVPGCRDATDLGIAAAHLFDLDGITDGKERPRAGAQPDGTLTIEEHDGVASEVDAAVDWVARRVLDGVPLDRIAVLTPAADPWCSLLASGLRRLDALPIEIAGGLPLAHTSVGARVYAVLRALQQHLGADALVDALCCVRGEDDQRRKPSRGRVFDLVHSLGTRGGSSANPSGALEWREKLALAEQRLAAPLEMAGFVDQEEHVARRHARRLATLRSLCNPLLALCALAEAVGRDASLRDLRPMLIAFVRDHVVQPTDGPRFHALLDDRLENLADDAICGRLHGPAVLELVVGLLSSMRMESDASDQAAIYIGTVSSAAGLTFDAVRVIGLSEGSIPPTVRGDPVLSDELRAQISPWLATGADRAIAALHRLDLVIRGTAKLLSLSAPRLAIDRTVREPSSVFIEVGAALARQGTPSRVPSLESLRRTDVRPSSANAERLRTLHPVSSSDWQDRLASGHREVPRRWRETSSLDVPTMLASAPTKGVWHAMDGLLGSGPGPALAGLDASLPTSAWLLNMLLQCPHRFLYEHVLGWEQPLEPPPGHDLDPMTFGNLVHNVAERFYRTHGEAFCSQEGTLASWRETSRAIASEELAQILATHGLDSRDASSAVQRKLRTHVDRLIEHGWAAGPRRFVAAELAFGFDKPLVLDIEGRELFVRGRIDLIDASAGETAVRDVKTSVCRPRRGHDSDASPTMDLQIGLYANIIEQLAPEIGVPRRVGASYVHTNDRRGTERAFTGTDADELRRAARDWLATARALLVARTFPRTPHEADCTFCRFKPICSEEGRARSKGLLQTATDDGLVRFRTMKAGA